MAKRVYSNSREKILETAEKILTEKGLGNLTTDTIVSESGLSKGGFFYNFKSIDDLIFALISKLKEEMDEEIQEIISEDPNPKGRTLRAHIRYSMRDHSESMLTFSKSLLEVLIKNRPVVEVITKYHKDELRKIKKEGLDEQTIMLISCAIDGFWHQKLLGVNVHPKKISKAFFEQLIEMTY